MRPAGLIPLLAFAGAPVLCAQAAGPGALAAQAVITVAPQQCVWRAGDNAAWAAPNLDESGWQHLPSAAMPDSAFFWIRCPVPLGDLRAVPHPALAAMIPAAYQEYVQGNLIAGLGNLRTGDFSEDVVHIQPLPRDSLSSPSAVVALRITERPQGEAGTGNFALTAGDAPLLQALRAQAVLQSVKPILGFVLLYCVVGVVGVVQIGLFFYDRARRDLLWLSLFCIVVAILRIDTLASRALVNYPNRLEQFLYLLGNFGFVLELIFFFALARRRIPWFVWGIYVASQAMDLLALTQWFLPPGPAQRLSFLYPAAENIGLWAWTLMTLVPFFVFWPWNRIASSLRPLALCCFLWGLCDFVYFLVQTVFLNVLHQPQLYTQDALVLFEVRAFVSGVTVLVILMLLFRDQRRIAEERALLAGEMDAAREIQRYLIPESLPPTPGLTIHSVYHPSREVGGDFFQVLPDARDGSTLIVMGDVAGKGLKAGMLAALIVGAIRTAFEFTSEPDKILALLNERLQGRGLVTCLAMRVDRNGNAELANAGQLPPYINGKEIALEGSLPLGALPALSFSTARLTLGRGESMLFVSDGVVEARNAAGELFGFERATKLSTEPAEKVAQAAQAFGQEDDITVLTLSFVPAGVVHA